MSKEFHGLYKHMFPFVINRLSKKSVEAQMVFGDQSSALAKLSPNIATIAIKITGRRDVSIESIINKASMFYSLLPSAEKIMFKGAAFYLMCQTLGWMRMTKQISKTASVTLSASGETPIAGTQESLVKYYQRRGFAITNDSDQDNVEMEGRIMLILQSCAEHKHIQMKKLK